MKSARVVVLAIIALAIVAMVVGSGVRADVTVRYKNEVKLGAGMPPTMGQQTAGIMKSTVPTETVIEIKGTKGYTSNGKLITLMDFAKQVITVVDPAHKQYATVYMKDYVDQFLALLPDATGPSSDAAKKILSSMKTTFASENTGKTDTILGIQAEETRLTLTIYMPTPNGAPSTESATANPPAELMKMILHVWTALPSDVDKIPALQEFSSVYGDPSAASALNPDAIMGKAFGSFPGMGRGFTDLMDELSRKKAVTLKTDIEMYMPFMAQALQSSAAAGKDQTVSFDPNAPVLEVNMTVDQISAAPIDDAVFEVPEDCQLASMQDFLRALLPAMAQASSTDPAPAATPPGGQQ